MNTKILITAIVVLCVAVLMAMTGRGGGNFYVPTLVATGASMHGAATSGQLVLIASALAAALVFQRHRRVDRRLPVAFLL